MVETDLTHDRKIAPLLRYYVSPSCLPVPGNKRFLRGCHTTHLRILMVEGGGTS